MLQAPEVAVAVIFVPTGILIIEFPETVPALAVTVDPAELVKLTEYVFVPVQAGEPKLKVGVWHWVVPPFTQSRSRVNPVPLPWIRKVLVPLLRLTVTVFCRKGCSPTAVARC